MLRVTFKGTEYLFTGDNLDTHGAITTPEAYAAGTVSFAHYFPQDGGVIMRWQEIIGTKVNLAIIGPAAEPEVTRASILNCLTHPSWETPDAD